MQPIEGVHEVLDQLPHPKCVASNGPIDVIQANLKTTALDHHFGNRIFSAYVIQKWKPQPDLFLHAAATLGYSKTNSIVIEDSLAGMQAGINAGMIVLAYVPPSHPYKVNIKGVIEFTAMEQLPEILDGIS
ncbi:MAG: HAD-IA family hydrolase [Saprospiraceae bacterium]|nr:HAD-IA family hydrolase [Saprospiraceae bacterium]